MREHDHLVEPLFAALDARSEHGGEQGVPKAATGSKRARLVASLLAVLGAAAWVVWLVV